jgi:hypothetical protein
LDLARLQASAKPLFELSQLLIEPNVKRLVEFFNQAE